MRVLYCSCMSFSWPSSKDRMSLAPTLCRNGANTCAPNQSVCLDRSVDRLLWYPAPAAQRLRDHMHEQLDELRQEKRRNGNNETNSRCTAKPTQNATLRAWAVGKTTKSSMKSNQEAYSDDISNNNRGLTDS